MREQDIGRLAARQALAIPSGGKATGALPILKACDFAYVVSCHQNTGQDAAVRVPANRGNCS